MLIKTDRPSVLATGTHLDLASGRIQPHHADPPSGTVRPSAEPSSVLPPHSRAGASDHRVRRLTAAGLHCFRRPNLTSGGQGRPQTGAADPRQQRETRLGGSDNDSDARLAGVQVPPRGLKHPFVIVGTPIQPSHSNTRYLNLLFNVHLDHSSSCPSFQLLENFPPPKRLRRFAHPTHRFVFEEALQCKIGKPRRRSAASDALHLK